jgi:hypothetical protein
MKIGNLVLTAVFSLFAAWQYNDPDPWRWATIYGFVAAVCGFAAFGKRNGYMILGALVVSVLWGLSLVPKFVDWIKMGSPDIAGQMKAESPYIEFTREFLGLAICMVVLTWQLWLSKRKQ